MLQPGEIVCAKYEIIKLVGRGGMSTVYQARDYVTGKLLAIKDVERSGRDNDQIVVQSLTTEGRMLKQLDNPHLPRIYDIIEDSTNFMLVMDYIEGVSLDKVIAQSGAQDPQKVYNWGMQICEVFDYLHRQTPPVIYRDMKPANVILQANGNLMMIDFGTARTQKGGQLLQSDTICIGTDGFAAPEQFGGMGESDARTDIFCLGSTLYNMITGHSPSERPKGILPLEQWNPSLADSPLNYIIEKCTRNDPNERYQTAMELYEDLRLASTGAFRNPSQKRGKSGPLSGGLRKVGWQEQKVRTVGGNTGGLSGLIGQTGKTGKTGRTDDKWNQPGQVVGNSNNGAVPNGWQQPTLYEPRPVNTPQWLPEQANQQVETTIQDSIWRKLMLISAVIASIFLIFCVLFLIINIIAVAVVMLVFAIAAVVLAVVGVVGEFKSRADSEAAVQ